MVIGLFATSHVGRVARIAGESFASFASARIAALFMSGEPTMYSRLMSVRTSLRPFTPITIDAMPNAMRIAAAM